MSISDRRHLTGQHHRQAHIHFSKHNQFLRHHHLWGHHHRVASFEIDMVHGPLLGKILLFSLPLMLSGVLQLLFNAADIIVVGRFTTPASIAAVGSTTALINLFISLFIGLSIGVNVLIARFHATEDDEQCRATVQTSVFMAIFGGILLALAGVFFARPILRLMGTPDDVIELASVYLRIYFAGMPVVLLYNFGSAVLRGVGDTRRPLIYLTVAGVINVCLNLLFVVYFGLGVAGVALATILSQAVSAFLVIGSLVHYEGAIRFDPAIRALRPDPGKAAAIFRIGAPAGLQSALFSISNVLIQSSVNSFGSTVMAGNAAAQNLEGFVYISMNALMQAATTFVSANYSVKDEKRVDRSVLLCVAVVTAVGLPLGLLVAYFGGPLVSIYTTEPGPIAYGVRRLWIICAPYVLCGYMDTLCGSVRGFGYSVIPMTVSLIGSCLFRVVWILTVFQMFHTLEILYLSYPITWTLTAAAHLVCLLVLKKRAFAQLAA